MWMSQMVTDRPVSTLFRLGFASTERSISLLLLLVFAGPAHAETYVIEPGPRVQYELQNRLIESMPGDVIQLEAGKYEFRGELNLNCGHVTLRGRGPDRTVLSFRGQQAGSDGILAGGDGIVIEDLAVEDTAGNAIKVLGAKGVAFRRVRTEWTDGPKSTNGAYGIYPVQCTDVLIDGCIAIGAADAGIYVGQCDRVVVRGCRAERNVVGIEIENTHNADVYANVSTGNTGGVLVVDLPGLPVVNGRATRVFRNTIQENNLRNFAPKGTTVADVPDGTGVMVLAANDVEVFENKIADHGTANVLIVSYLIAGRPLPKTKYDPYPEGIAVHDNAMSGGGRRPAGKLGELVAPVVGGRFADIVIDGAQDQAKFVDGKLPEELGIRITENDGATFLNFNLASLNPVSVLSGKYRIGRDLGPYSGELPSLPTVTLQPAPASTNTNPAVAVYRAAPRLLSEWGLFDGPVAEQRAAAGVIPYELNTTLFSDETSKHRLLRLPAGGQVRYRSEGSLEFPDGTVISKTFAMPGATGASAGGERLIETRIQIRKESGWYAFSYQWDEQQQDAKLVLGGGVQDLQWSHADGTSRSNRYEIPNANQCLTCHSENGRFAPLGPTAGNLNRNVETPKGPVNQLAHWQTLGILADLPELASVPKLPKSDDPHSGSVAERARAWLDVNCAHCHRPEGSARTAGLDLRMQQTNEALYGILKSPVAAGRGTGGRKYDITPGKPDESILIYRMESTEPGVRMPNLSRNLVATDGLELVREWIRSMPAAERE
jgi:parallel beta-helix repeat protein